jgi:membrane-bound inhibitor of C-type lysozyme
MRGRVILATACLCASGAASASDLTVPFPDGVSISQQAVRYQCDSNPASVGLPNTPFTVTYLDAGDNHLAVIDIHGARVVFVRAGMGTSAHYVSGSYTWWDAPGGEGTFLAVDMPPDLGGMQSTLCQRINSP